MSTHEPKAAAAGVSQTSAPTEVEIVYRKIDGLHVFDAPDFPGLHAADANLESAFDMIADAVTAYMQSSAADALAYRPAVTFATFKKRLEASSPRDWGRWRNARTVIVSLKSSQQALPQHAIA